MLRPIIIIGCGGAGQKTVQYARDAISRYLMSQGWEGDFPKAWQFLAIDASANQEHGSAPVLPNSDYISLSNPRVDSQSALFDLFEEKFGIESNPRAFRESLGWKPNTDQVTSLLRQSPGQWRAIGRMLGLISMQDVVKERLEIAFAQCAAGGKELAEVSQLLANSQTDSTNQPWVVVVGSMAGGIGSGIMLDVVDLLYGTNAEVRPTLVAFTPDIFSGLGPSGSLAANSAAFMAELLSTYWAEEKPENVFISTKIQNKVWRPHGIFLIGRTNLEGLDLQNPENVYRVVAQTFAAATTSSELQLSIAHILGTWSPRSQITAHDNNFFDLNNVASSFGSATISIGRIGFHDYLKKLLHRSVVEHLARGFEPAATEILGHTAKSMIDSEKIGGLTQRHIDRFVIDCGLSECELKLEEIARHLLSIQVTLKSNESIEEVLDQMISHELRQWGSEIFQKTLTATNENCGRLSIPVVLSLLNLTREQVRTKSLMFRESSDKKSAGDVNSATNNFIRERLALALESVAATMLSDIEVTVNQSLTRLNILIKSQANSAAIVEWPKNNGIVPISFEPSFSEFYLEDFKTWPQVAKRLISESLGDETVLPIDPIDAARLLIIRGGFVVGHGVDQLEIKPLIWSDSHDSQPVWQPGQKVSIVIGDDMEQMSKRINCWLMRSDEICYTLNESLRSYLDSPSSPTTFSTWNKLPLEIDEHQLRLATFRQKLTLTLTQSRPLIDLDRGMLSSSHSLSSWIVTQGFPFEAGHAAREVVEQVLREFLPDFEFHDFERYFSSHNSESVLITNLLVNPAHPSCIKSFTQPLHSALDTFPQGLLHSSFWKWRRSRILEDFIPLPRRLRVAAIRGFAVARIIGAITASPTTQNLISTEEGVFKFPRNLLTEPNYSILPCLLEAMVLTFADTATQGKDAFNAYRALIEYGEGAEGSSYKALTSEGISSFKIDGIVEQILKTGDYGNIKILDLDRAKTLGDTPTERAVAANAYLDRSIKFFDELDATDAHPHNWRNDAGSVDPINTLTRELLPELRTGYEMVREAMNKFENPRKPLGY